MECREACPTNAISIRDGKTSVDIGRCLFCVECAQACPQNAVTYSKEFRISAFNRRDLILSGDTISLAQQFNTVHHILIPSLMDCSGSLEKWNQKNRADFVKFAGKKPLFPPVSNGNPKKIVRVS
jgi:formate hydrogenlyase subunit 6/NADH:ubiquinone oxidoreductase subunit I